KLVERIVEEAIEKCRAIDRGMAVERRHVRRHAVTLGAIVAAVALVIAFGPAFLRHGISALLIVSRSAEAASPYHIEVTPGNAKIPRGADQSVTAKLLGFTAKDAALLMRTSPSGQYERVP